MAMGDRFVVRVAARGNACGPPASTRASWPTAEITNTGGLLDLRSRCLLPDPGQIWRSAAKAPELLGL